MVDTATFGRRMMEYSVSMNDDDLCNAFCRVGDLLTKIGQPRAPKSIKDITNEDMKILMTAIEMIGA